MNIKEDVSYLIRLKDMIKKLQDKEKATRQVLLDVAREATNKTYLLPKKTIEIPRTFWETTDLDPLSFILTRYPAWDLVGRHDSITGTEIFVLQRKPEYEGWVWEDEDLKVIKVVQEGTPEIDWASLDKEFPKLKERITDRQETITYQLNDDKMAEELGRDPQLFVKLERHLLPKEPTLQIRTSKKKKNAIKE